MPARIGGPKEEKTGRCWTSRIRVSKWVQEQQVVVEKTALEAPCESLHFFGGAENCAKRIRGIRFVVAPSTCPKGALISGVCARELNCEWRFASCKLRAGFLRLSNCRSRCALVFKRETQQPKSFGQRRALSTSVPTSASCRAILQVANSGQRQSPKSQHQSDKCSSAAWHAHFSASNCNCGQRSAIIFFVTCYLGRTQVVLHSRVSISAPIALGVG